MTRAILVVGVLVVASCSSKRAEGVIATVESVVKEVERQTSAGEAWQAANVGDELVMGSAVRTGEASSARLRISGSLLELQASAVVRLASDPGEGSAKRPRDIRIEAGSVEIETTDEPLAIGEAILERGAKARVSADAEGLEISVSVGRAIIENVEGKPVEIAAGKRIKVKIGGAILESVGPIARKPAQMIDAGVAADAAETIVAPETPAGMLVKVTGKQVRVRGVAGWRAVAPGEHRFEPGTRLDAKAGSTFELVGDGARVVSGGPAELVIGGATGELATLTAGAVALHAESTDASIALPGGTLEAASGSEARVRVTKRGAEVESLRGAVAIRTTKGGESLQLGDVAVVEADGTLAFSNRAPTRVVLSIPAGESAVIHDLKAPTAIGVRFGGACSDEGRLEVSKDRGFARIIARTGGRTGGNVLLAPGGFSYRVQCPGKGAKGSLQIVRDLAFKTLPKRAPRTQVDADGREYVITYQNLLPELTLSWREAPPRAKYVFVIQTASGAPKRITSRLPRVSVKSGEIGEGRHRFWVETPETGGSSPETRIEIEFDNALSSVAFDRVEAKEGKIVVRGVALEGTRITVEDSPIALDRQQRFNAELVPRPGDNSVAIRIAHPKLGIHYYVIRSGTK